MELYDSQFAQRLDQHYCSTEATGSLLMMRAAKAIFEHLQDFDRSGKIWCLAGAGNNGGDAYGVAALAMLNQRSVSLITCGAAINPSHPVIAFASELGLDLCTDLPALESCHGRYHR